MPSSYTPRNRLTKQAPGEGLNVWGTILNTGVFDLVDFLADGVTTISAGGATSLSAANGTADQARARVLNVTATSAATITIPAVEKLYLVRAATADVTVTAGGTTATVKAGDIAWVFCDGSAVRKAQSRDFAGAKLTSLGSPTADTDAATKKYVDDAAFNANAGVLPGQTGNAGRLLTTNGATASWGPQHLLQAIAANATLAHDTPYSVDTTAARTLTLPSLSTAAAGQPIIVRDGTGTAAAFNISIVPAGLDVFLNSITSPLLVDVDRGAVMLEATAAGWRVHPL